MPSITYKYEPPFRVTPGPVDREPFYCATAARFARLPPEHMSAIEKHCFPDVYETGKEARKYYCDLRNSILQMWQIDVQKELSWTHVKRNLAPQYAQTERLASRILAFLDRWGCVNIGCFDPAPANQQVSGAVSMKLSNQRSVVVVGAGLAGIACAKSLARFGLKVTLIEATHRLGGRVFTYAHGNWRADLGANIIYSVPGNPLHTLLKQIALTSTSNEATKQETPCKIPIAPKMNLYDFDGKLVIAKRDQLVEAEFNRLLEMANRIAHTKNIHSINGKFLSLATTIDAIVALQQRRVSMKRMEQIMMQEENLNRCKQILDQLEELGKEIEIESKCLKELEETKIDNKFDTRQNIDNRLVYRARVFRHNLKIQAHTDLLAEYNTLTRDLNQQMTPANYMNPAEKRLVHWHMAAIESATGTSAYDLSLPYWDHATIYASRLDSAKQQDKHCMLSEGCARLVTHLVASMRGDAKIVAGTIVTSIDYSNELSNIRLSTLLSERHGGAPSPYSNASSVVEADAVCLTVPLGVLKRSINADDQPTKYGIQFHPPLPDWKCDAIKKMGFGVLNKVLLHFDTRFWEHSANKDTTAMATMFGRTTDPEQRGEMSQFTAVSSHGKDGPCTVICTLSGRAAEQCEKLQDSILQQRALSILTNVFGSALPQPKETIVSRWRRMPYALGSHSFVGVETTPDVYDTMAYAVSDKSSSSPETKSNKKKKDDVTKIQKQLFFAGEHTCREHPATMHGAFLSGLREAGRIAHHLLGSDCYLPTAADYKLDWASILQNQALPIKTNAQLSKRLRRK